MRYYLISESWLISRRARRVYRWCAGISFLLLPAYVALYVLAAKDMLTPGSESVLRLALLIGVAASAVVWVAMEHFLFVEDESSGWEEIFWFLVLLIPGIGPGLYVFLGYSRSELFHARTSTSSVKRGK